MPVCASLAKGYYHPESKLAQTACTGFAQVPLCYFEEPRPLLLLAYHTSTVWGHIVRWQFDRWNIIVGPAFKASVVRTTCYTVNYALLKLSDTIYSPGRKGAA